jgi:hypothetical protein
MMPQYLGRNTNLSKKIYMRTLQSRATIPLIVYTFQHVVQCTVQVTRQRD